MPFYNGIIKSKYHFFAARSDMSFPRSSGIILHPTSLPSPFGIGDLGDQAYRFADFLEETGSHLWQMLPLGPTGYGNSPYQSLSVFAGNPLLINPERLYREDLPTVDDMENIPSFNRNMVEFKAVGDYKRSLFKKSWAIFEKEVPVSEHNEFEAFCRENANWLDTFALFMALREAHDLRAWNTWEDDIKLRKSEAVEAWTEKLQPEINIHKYQQFHFFRQWHELKSYCNDHKIRLIGDIPIFVAFDSADVWSQPDLFRLDKNGNPTVVAGVPPDYFSRTGQLWGNPIYRWDEMAKNGYNWWVERIRTCRWSILSASTISAASLLTGKFPAEIRPPSTGSGCPDRGRSFSALRNRRSVRSRLLSRTWASLPLMWTL